MVRHGQVNGHDLFRVYGHTDVAMTEVGMIQMERLAERLRLADIRAIYSSDLERSIRGARIISQYHDVSIQKIPELKELFFGAWEGLTLNDIRHRFPDELERREADLLHFMPPGDGESIAEFSRRVLSTLKRILREQKGNDILVVAHGVVNRIILCDALGLELNNLFRLQQDYGCLNIIDYFADSLVVKLING
ncbi:histidine phosphatase family protein [Thermodesulfobacteriota bacterium]